MKVLDRIPFVSAIKRDLTALRRLLYDRRAPRIAAIGAAGSGRTSLVHALLNAVTFGEGGAAPPPAPGAWVRIDADGRRLDWLELPAGLEPDERDELAKRAFEESPPDLVLALVEAGAEETSGAVHDALAPVLAYLEKEREKKPPVLVLVTKVDTIA